jgi:uncharacterized protein
LADDSNRECVQKFFDAYYAGDIETATACCDADLDTIIYAPVDLFPHLGQKRGCGWVGEAIRIQQARYSSRRYEFRYIAVDGDHVAAIQWLSLIKRNDDRVVQLETAEFLTMRAGLILTHRSFFDSFDLVQQLLGRDLTDGFAADVREAIAR